MSENPLRDWELKRERLVVKRVLEAGLEFSLENVPAIVEEMSYENQRQKNPSDCPCYTSRPCHPEIKNLNCFLCACPVYDSEKTDENGEIIGGCKINSRRGKYLEPFPSIAGKVWDCSGCTAYHSSRVVGKYLGEHFEEYRCLAEEIKKE